MNPTPFGAALLCCCLTARPAPAAETPDQLMAAALDGNRAAIRAIQTMECRYERVPCLGTTAEEAGRSFLMHWGRFWRSGETFRTFESYGNADPFQRESVVWGGRMFELYYRSRDRNHAVLSVGALDLHRDSGGALWLFRDSGGAPWEYLLFSNWGPGPASDHTLDEFLRYRATVRAAERLPSGEIHLTLSHSGASRLEFWLDPKVNHLVRKYVWVTSGDTAIRVEREVVEFAEPAASVFVPSVVEVRLFTNGARVAAARTRITELQVNHPLPDSSLRLPGIAGMTCTDFDREVEYAVDADGSPAGPVKAIYVYRNSGMLVAGPRPPGNTRNGPATSIPPGAARVRPAEWWRWPAALSAVAVAGLVALAIMRRAGSN